MEEFFLTIGFLNAPKQDFITDLAIIMILAAIVTLAFFKMRQPLIIGYLFAGMLLGPLYPIWTSFLPQSLEPSSVGRIGILSDLSVLNVFADIGIILLLFVIGIEFPIAKIKSIGKVAVGIASIELFSALIIIFLIGIEFGLKFMDSLFLAAALSISSTAIIINNALFTIPLLCFNKCRHERQCFLSSCLPSLLQHHLDALRKLFLVRL